jgi:hypothetical protein
MPTASAAASGTPQGAAALRVDVLPSLVQPGGSARVAVSYVKNALVQVNVHLPQQHPFWLSGTTDSHGHLTLAVRVPRHVPLRHGHAVVSLDVRAMAGPWHSLATLSAVVRPGATRHINVSYTPQTPVRALVTVPGARPLRLFGVTDSQGHLQLSLMVPRGITVHQGRTTAHVAVFAWAGTQHARATRTLAISDMVVSVTLGPLVNCLQTQTVHVAYHPNVPLRIVLLFPHNHQLALTAHTDRQGGATVSVRLAYVKAPNPLHSGVEAIDTSVRPPRLERIAFAVALPPACRSSAQGSSGP